MKKEYIKPSMQVVLLQHRTMLLQASVTGVQSTNLDDEDDFLWGGGGNQNAR